MKYGKDCCIGSFVDGKWVDSTKWKFIRGLLPKLQPFIYEDDKTDGWLLLEDFSIRIKEEVITVKAFFDLDLTSIPRFFWTAVGSPADVRKLVAGLIHDGLYASNAKSQKESDHVFLELLEAFDTSWFIRNTCFTAVSGFGWTVYPKTKKELEEYKDFIVITKITKEPEVIEPLLS
jgi:hypothetical protein